ncbi:TlpA family protein disulfide reductase [Flavobacterium quisquiliarum]|uniref:TlpA family protein disulfide reductase n=1 Tax=Flavobacterium quisquiliarum TaxID=1834436 RepID=A0ABV8W9S7_9FLAO|nr:TlpA disulfide reductase family protein [Flavobacterium quisquiliarum]MBW1654119.1 redoxin domain-containing protein [Flavobacterium quisquiliarum]NWL00889.1 hypothetical protein [Flavobacterium collinsii]
MNHSKFSIALFFLIAIFSCSEKQQDSGLINADLSTLTKDFDKVVISMWGYPFLGDSTTTSDTVEAKNGKFQYHFKIKEVKVASFILLKNNKKTAELGFKNINKNGTTNFGNIYLGNENIVISGVREIPVHYTESHPYKNYLVNIKGSKEADIRMKVMNGKNFTSVESIKSNPDSYAILYELFFVKEKYSLNHLKKLSLLFSDDLKKSISFTKLQDYIKSSEELEKYGYTKGFNFIDINGKKYSFDDIKKGKSMTLLIFWASWCGPCRQEIPALKEFYYKYKGKVSMVSLSIDHDYKSWRLAVEKENMPWPNLSQLPSKPTGIEDKFNINAVPTLILLDKNGSVVVNAINNLAEIEKTIHIN